METLCKPDCELCGGSGMIRGDVPESDPRFGQILPCPRRPLASLITDCGLVFEELESLDPADLLPVNDAGKAWDAIAGVIARGYGIVYLYGPVGVGKTTLIKTALVSWLRQVVHPSVSYLGHYRRGVYRPMSYIVEALRSAFDNKQQNDEGAIGYWNNLRFLALDELDKVRGTEFALEQRFALIDARYNAAVSKSGITLIAGQVAPVEYGQYIQDRLCDGRNFVIEMAGKSLRPAQE